MRPLIDALFRGGPPKSAFRYFDHDAPLTFAHRGGMGLWPENTCYAFGEAAALGVDGLEMDVHLTRDGVLVVNHDATVDRCTDGTGAIAGMTRAELQALDAGYRWTADDGATHPFRGKGIHVPTLAEVLESFPRHRYIIDCKPEDPRAAMALAECVTHHGMADRVVLASFHASNLYAVRRAYPGIATSVGEREAPYFVLAHWGRIERLYRPPAPVLQLPVREGRWTIITEPFVRAAHGRGMDVHAWTINDPDEMRQLRDWGVNGVITDFPDRLLAAWERIPV